MGKLLMTSITSGNMANELDTKEIISYNFNDHNNVQHTLMYMHLCTHTLKETIITFVNYITDIQRMEPIFSRTLREITTVNYG